MLPVQPPRPRRASAAWRAGLPAALALTTALGAAAAVAADCTVSDSTPWPMPEWTTAAPAGGAAAVAALEAYAFPPSTPEAEVAREGMRTNAAVLIQDGRLVWERYARGFNAETPHIAWSAAKSVTATLIGRAIQDGLLEGVDQPASRFVPGLAEGGKEAMTIRHLLGMASGLDYSETYEFAPLWSDVVAMLYNRGRADMAGYTAARPLAAPPGSRWSYSSGDTVLLAAALRGIVGAERYPDYPWTALFDPLGMQGAVFERDPAGTFVGSSNLYLRARDLARIGLLYAQDGCWAGRRLLPEGWVAQSATGGTRPAGRAYYGAQWWLGSDASGLPAAAPGAPSPVLSANGHWGQFLVVIPSTGTVLVRNGDDRAWGAFSLDRMIEFALAVARPRAMP